MVWAGNLRIRVYGFGFGESRVLGLGGSLKQVFRLKA